MRFLRTLSTRRLLAVFAGVVVAVAAGSAIAIAATGGGAVPAPKPLASAVHSALSAPAVGGITARVRFTNNLISASDIQGSDPLLNGGSGRLWLSPGHGLRLEIQGNNGDAQLVVNRGSFWAYDPASHTAYEGSLPPDAAGSSKSPGANQGIPSVAQIQSAIARLAGYVGVSPAIPGDVAGRPTYTVRVTPKDSGGLLGGVSLAWDAAKGVPLRFDVYARGDSTPVLDLTATSISYGKVPASVFAISPPHDAHMVRVDLPATTSGTAAPPAHARMRHAEITGVNAVASRLSFPLDAPSSLAGLARSSVSLLGNGTQAGAALTYGQGLGAIYVIERPSTAAAKLPSAPSDNPDQPGLSLPTLTLKHATAQVLPTALGTVVQFTRGGVSYTVAGSVTQAVAQRAAASL